MVRPISMTLGCTRLSRRLGFEQLNLGRSFSVSYPSSARASADVLRLSSLQNESDHSKARRWLDDFQLGDIPKDIWTASYSRSSGPGGQHVNKTNSKATIRCDLTRSASWLPPFLLPPLSKSPHYIPNPPSILISSQETRTASQNLSAALVILHQTILNAGRTVIVGETSEVQKNRVERLVRAEKGRVRVEKERRSSKKSARRDF